MDKRIKFAEIHPFSFFLDIAKPESITDFLQERSFLTEGESVLTLEKPGEGNMNCVLRATTNKRNFILKQSRPWVEKYPHIHAPTERSLVEAAYLQHISSYPSISNQGPQLLAFYPEHYLLILEDLGDSADYTYLYQKGQELEEPELLQLVDYISSLHAIKLDAKSKSNIPLNSGMRKLNHFHIFEFPFQIDNGFDLDQVQEGLQKISIEYKEKETLDRSVKALGDLYLSEGRSLLHGDYYPGSWLKVGKSIKIIDPEFGFVGFPEFDLGVMLAHLLMSQQGVWAIRRVLKKYEMPRLFDRELLAGFTGVEILRRIIGLAQLPLELELKEKCELLEKAKEGIISGNVHLFAE